ncbi:ferredoxin [Streptomyces europaeiscabiei]|jgi:ferredoxin|uniref:ferredoxin n=1 Tax=Streptomyces europaeiscabiei TaxID=146819 RepID=UPI0038F71581
MSLHLSLDVIKCQGYAACLIEAPEIWDFDDENDRAILKIADLDESLRAKAEASVRVCPAKAIAIEDGAT